MIPAIPIKDSKPHNAISAVVKPADVQFIRLAQSKGADVVFTGPVFVFFTVVINTLAKTTTPIVSEIIPLIKLAIVCNLHYIYIIEGLGPLAQPLYIGIRSRSYAIPNTDITPYMIPAIPINDSNPQRAISELSHPVVLVPFIVTINTLARTTTPIVKEIIPAIKLAIF